MTNKYYHISWSRELLKTNLGGGGLAEIVFAFQNLTKYWLVPIVKIKKHISCEFGQNRFNHRVGHEQTDIDVRILSKNPSFGGSEDLQSDISIDNSKSTFLCSL